MANFGGASLEHQVPLCIDSGTHAPTGLLALRVLLCHAGLFQLPLVPCERGETLRLCVCLRRLLRLLLCGVLPLLLRQSLRRRLWFVGLLRSCEASAERTRGARVEWVRTGSATGALNYPPAVVLAVRVVGGDARLVDVLVVGPGEPGGGSLVRTRLDAHDPRDGRHVRCL